MSYLPNPLATRNGRLIAFFFLYVSEGIPFGFTSTAMSTEMKRMGIGDASIGLFTASLYLPWAWKWLMGPFVDTLYIRRLGHRRGWILIMQFLMVATLLACRMIDVTPENLKLLTGVIFVHNAFCATQDVAIDALACNVLSKDELGTANGLMFAGQTLGIPLGGACVLYLKSGISWLPGLEHGMPFTDTYWFVAGCVFAITALVVIPLREKEPRRKPNSPDSRLDSVFHEIAVYGKTAFRSLFCSRMAFVAFLFAIMPAGAMSLNLALQKTLAVEVGMSDTQIADLEIVSSVFWALACVGGGFLADRVGHLKCVAAFIALMSLPTIWLGYQMQSRDFIMPAKKAVVAAQADQSDGSVDKGGSALKTKESQTAAKTETQPASTPAEVSNIERPDQRDAGPNESEQSPPLSNRSGMLNIFWLAVMIYMVIQGLMYGTRSAIFMRISNPEIAATQFTAYMAMMNLATSYTAAWQGVAIEKYGYPFTLFVDGGLGLLCLVVIPFLHLFRDKSGEDGGPADHLELEPRLD